MDLHSHEVLSFDCYGTLIDWESGILAALGPVLAAHDVHLSDAGVLELYAEIEPKAQAGPFVTYREVLRKVMRGLGDRLGFSPSPSEMDRLADSIGSWRPFPDSVEALRTLGRTFRLAVITNMDDDLFALSATHLNVNFEWVITSEQSRSYKPSLSNFRLAFEKIGVGREKLLHIAQSVYHDIVPARALGLNTGWVNRRGHAEGSGATRRASGEPDLEVPDLATLASIVESRLRPEGKS